MMLLGFIIVNRDELGKIGRVAISIVHMAKNEVFV
jgi:hypothetical protein